MADNFLEKPGTIVRHSPVFMRVSRDTIGLKRLQSREKVTFFCVILCILVAFRNTKQ